MARSERNLGRREDPSGHRHQAGAEVRAYLHRLALGLLGHVTGVLLQPLDAHQHGLCLREAAHQAREQTRQGQGIRQ